MLDFGFSALHNNRPGRLHLTLKYLTASKYREAKNNYMRQAMHRTTARNTCLLIIDNPEGNDNMPSCKDFLPVAFESIYKTTNDGQKIKEEDNEVIASHKEKPC